VETSFSTNTSVYSMAFDSNNYLYAGGEMNTANNLPSFITLNKIGRLKPTLLND